MSRSTSMRSHAHVLTAEAGPAAVSDARRQVTWQLESWGRADLVDDAALAVSELVSNAVLHGTGPVGIRLIASDAAVRLEVSDTSDTPPVPMEPMEMELTCTVGRGLTVVAALSARWGWAPESEGKVVWCEFASDAPEAADEPAAVTAVPPARDAAVPPDDARPGPPVAVADVPVTILRQHVLHTDEQLRELRLAAREGAGALSALIARVREVTAGRSLHARLRAQALAALHPASERVRVTVEVPTDVVEEGIGYLATLDELDAYCRAERLLALESAPVQRCFRRWLVGELLTAAERHRGRSATEPRPFESALAEEVEGLAASRTLVERVLEAAPDAVVGVDRNGTVRLVNRQTELLFGYDREELIGHPLEILIPDDARGVHPGHRAAYFTDPVTRPMGAGLELRGRRRDGSQFPVDISLSSLETDEGLLVTAAVRDLTGMRRMRESLQETHRIAEILQRSLLGAVPTRVGGLTVAARYRPAQTGATVGGDWHDVFPLADGLVGITVGDVGGHGIEAAAVMGRLRTALAAVAPDEPDPGRVLEKVNRMLCSVASDDGNLLATALYGTLDLAAGTFVHAVAGQPGPVVMDAAAATATLDPPPPNLPLGFDAGTVFATHRVELPASGRLLVFTDGVYERRGTSITDSLRTLVLAAAELAPRRVDEIADALLATGQPRAARWSDDVALVVVGW